MPGGRPVDFSACPLALCPGPVYSLDMSRRAATLPTAAVPSEFARTFPAVRVTASTRGRVPCAPVTPATAVAAHLTLTHLAGLAGGVVLADARGIELVVAAPAVGALDRLALDAGLHGMLCTLRPASPTRISITLRRP